jgi:hypothetical protein
MGLRGARRRPVDDLFRDHPRATAEHARHRDRLPRAAACRHRCLDRPHDRGHDRDRDCLTREAGKSDQRDREINRLGEYVGGSVLATGMLVPFVLALAEYPHFWIANAMYLAFVVGAICRAAVKLVAYRRGL